jgi:hypothetical protein
MSNNTEIQEFEPQRNTQVSSGAFCGDLQIFEDSQRIAGALAQSTLVPKDYQNNVANCMIAMEMAQRVNANPMAVMQNLYIIHGKPSWSSQFIIAMINGCGKFSPLRFEIYGKPSDLDNMGCRAYSTDLASDEKLEGPWVTMKMAKAEGWISKSGSKWKTMPDLMMRYRAAAFFGRLYAPELLMGMSSDDEQQDIKANNQPQEKPRAARGFNPAKKSEPEIVEPEMKEINPAPTDQDIADKF